MEYDPIKKGLGGFFNQSRFLRILFYRLLDLLLLRAWHIHKEIKTWSKGKGNQISVLDAGSGFGQYSYWLHRLNRNWAIRGVDVKDEQVADCNRFFSSSGANQVSFSVEDLTKYIQPDAYDLILSVDVMEHIEEDVQVFKNFAASLKKGGMLIISTPSDQGGSDVSEEGESSFIGEHVRDGYNMNEIDNKLTMAGFSRVSARYSYGTPGKISWKLSMKYPIVLLGVSRVFYLILPFYYVLVYPICFVLNWLDVSRGHHTGTGLIVKAWK
jgi:SAM-dependent methyltransferase